MTGVTLVDLRLDCAVVPVTAHAFLALSHRRNDTGIVTSFVTPLLLYSAVPITTYATLAPDLVAELGAYLSTDAMGGKRNLSALVQSTSNCSEAPSSTLFVSDAI